MNWFSFEETSKNFETALNGVIDKASSEAGRQIQEAKAQVDNSIQLAKQECLELVEESVSKVKYLVWVLAITCFLMTLCVGAGLGFLLGRVG